MIYKDIREFLKKPTIKKILLFLLAAILLRWAISSGTAKLTRSLYRIEDSLNQIDNSLADINKAILLK